MSSLLIMMVAITSAMMLPTSAEAQRVVRYVDTTRTTIDEAAFQRWNIVLRVGAGFDQIGKDDTGATSNVSSDTKAGFTYKVSVGAEFRATERFSVIAGIEMNQRRHRMEYTYGGLTGSVDFVEKQKYTVQYFAFPVSAAYDVFQIDMPLYVGLAFCVPMKGTIKYDYDSNSSGLSVDGPSKSDISYDILNCVPELRIGFWDRNSIWGMEMNYGLKNAYEKAKLRKYFGLTAYLCF